MSDQERAVMQQALEFLEAGSFVYPTQLADNLRAALAQEQPEPDHETRAELAEQQIVQLAEERDHYRNMWQRAQQPEPVQHYASIPGTNVRVRLQPEPHDAGSHDQQMTPAVQRVVDAADKRARDKAAMPANCTTPTDCRAHGCHGECLPAAISTEHPEPVQEPVAWNWMLDGRPYGQAYYGNPPDADIAERAAISGRTVRLLYAKPFGSKPLTDEEIDTATAQERDALLDHIYEYGTAAEGVLERIRKLCRAAIRMVEEGK